MTHEGRPRIVYVMGRGHSGSTLLDSLLGAASTAFGVGELAAGMRRYDQPCSCGESIGDCTVWTSIRRRFEVTMSLGWDEAGCIIEQQARVQHFVEGWFARPEGSEVERLVHLTRQMLAAIADESGASVVIDSSKEISRGLFLAKFVPEARLVHLVRNPEDMLASTLERIRSGVGFRFMRRTYRRSWLEPLFIAIGSIGWLVGNVLAELAASHAGTSRSLRLRYEDLCADAPTELRRLGRFAGLDLTDVVDAVQSGASLPLGHKLAGNRLLGTGGLRFDPSRASDRRLPFAYVILNRLITWPLMIRYGYPVTVVG